MDNNHSTISEEISKKVEELGPVAKEPNGKLDFNYFIKIFELSVFNGQKNYSEYEK